MSQDTGGSQKKSVDQIGQQLGQQARAVEEAQALQQRASALGNRLSAARSQATLGDLRGSLGRLDSLLSGMPAALDEVRRGGYLFKGFLEKKIEVLRQQWQGLRVRIDTEAAQQGRILSQQADQMQQRLSALGGSPSAPLLDVLERRLIAVETDSRPKEQPAEGHAVLQIGRKLR